MLLTIPLFREENKRGERANTKQNLPFRLVSVHVKLLITAIRAIIIHQTHYKKSECSRAFNQFTIPCELDMINAISAADIAFIMPGY